eukprot:scaffold66351_cov63-Phaeocystis_antarctica.AAC.3
MGVQVHVAVLTEKRWPATPATNPRHPATDRDLDTHRRGGLLECGHRPFLVAVLSCVLCPLVLVLDALLQSHLNLADELLPAGGFRVAPRSRMVGHLCAAPCPVDLVQCDRVQQAPCAASGWGSIVVIMHGSRCPA